MAIGGNIFTQAKVRQSSISAIVTRANGRVENLGMIAFYHQNPIICFLGNAWIKLKRAFR